MTTKEAIKEAIEETECRLVDMLPKEYHPELDEDEIEEIAQRKAKEVDTQPIKDPSELLVEVDGEIVEGKLFCIDRERVEIVDRKVVEGNWIHYFDDFELNNHHIRLLKPNGEVVMDNQKKQKTNETN